MQTKYADFTAYALGARDERKLIILQSFAHRTYIRSEHLVCGGSVGFRRTRVAKIGSSSTEWVHSLWVISPDRFVADLITRLATGPIDFRRDSCAQS